MRTRRRTRSLALSRIIYRIVIPRRTSATISHFRMDELAPMRVRNLGQTHCCRLAFESRSYRSRHYANADECSAVAKFSRNENESVEQCE